MDEKVAVWLKENVDKFRDPNNRVRISHLEAAVEKKFGVFDQGELFRWLEENQVSTTNITKLREKYGRSGMGGKVGWPKGRPRGKRTKPVKALNYLDGKDGFEFTAFAHAGKVFIALEDAQRIFGK